MLKNIITAAAIGSLMTSAAFAQTTMPNSSATSNSPAATTNNSPSMSTTGTTGTTHVVNAQTADQWLATKFKGTDVIGADNAKIGDVSDILFDKSGKVVAVIIGVGGFLGIGQKDVALSLDSFQVVPAHSGDANNSSSDKLRLSMTKDQLKSAAAFEPYRNTTSTTGSNNGMNNTNTTRTPAAPMPAAPTTPPRQ